MEFKRLIEFCSTANPTTPRDDIRVRLPNALKQNPQVFEPFEQALQRLTQRDWEFVKEKLTSRTLKDNVRGWSQFYETLTEARGYSYLLDEGYRNVHFLEERQGIRTPDIEAESQEGNPVLLESKCIGFSDDERKYILENTRKLDTNEDLETREVTEGMPEPLKNKMISTVDSAKQQLLGYLPTVQSVRRIVYLNIQLDIPMLLDMKNFAEVVNFVRKLIRSESEVEIIVDELSSF